MKLINFFKKIKFKKSCVLLSLDGCNLERTLNFLCNKNIELFGVERTGIKTAKIFVKPKDKQQAIKLLKEKNIKVVKEESHGLIKTFAFFKQRWGLVLGIFLAVSFFVIFSNFLFKIEIFGLESVSKTEIIKVLQENNVSYFKNLNSVSTKEVEEIIIKNFEDVSLVSAVVKGNSLIINIKEKLKNEEFENLNSLQPIVASGDGIIKNINLIQGTLNVKVGDVVKKGDVLVLPYTVDSAGRQIPISPKAEILAEVWLVGTSTHSESEVVKTRTGRSIKTRETSICGMPLFSSGGQNIFEQFEVEVKENYLSTQILPIKYKEIFYFETKCDILEIDFEKVKDQKIEEAKNNALLKCDEVNIVSERFTISENFGKFVVTYTVTTEKDIAS
ncbi:MAG: sporulation protein YqfD [Clostridia bacterium]|nr:sporulation protein YqfD [Clostridia bacterium]